MSSFPYQEPFYDPILKTGALYRADTHPQKINVGIGAYRDAEGNPIIFDCVQEAEKIIIEKKTEFLKEYPPLSGQPDYLSSGAKLLLGEDHSAIKQNRVASVQSIAGSGALFIGFRYLAECFGDYDIYFPGPTWPNHHAILNSAVPGKKCKTYRFFDNDSLAANAAWSIEDIRAIPKKSVVLFHACAHNPTGGDFRKEEWDLLAEVCKAKDHIVFFDCAYPGFATGDIEADLYAPRKFAGEGIEVLVAQSFSKIMGLYGERAGIFHIVHRGEEKLTESLNLQLSRITRSTWSMGPIHGADIVRLILGSPELKAKWVDEIGRITGRVVKVRNMLFERITEAGIPSPAASGDWEHIRKQTGMFSFMGIAPNQCRHMMTKHHIYMVESSRICLCGLNMHNLDYFVASLKETLDTVPPIRE